MATLTLQQALELHTASDQDAWLYVNIRKNISYKAACALLDEAEQMVREAYPLKVGQLVKSRTTGKVYMVLHVNYRSVVKFSRANGKTYDIRVTVQTLDGNERFDCTGVRFFEGFEVLSTRQTFVEVYRAKRLNKLAGVAYLQSSIFHATHYAWANNLPAIGSNLFKQFLAIGDNGKLFFNRQGFELAPNRSIVIFGRPTRLFNC